MYIEMRNESLNVFKGQKERNRMSMARGAVSFFGDFLGIQNSPADLHTLTGERKILFSDRVNKINPAYKVSIYNSVDGNFLRNFRYKSEG